MTTQTPSQPAVDLKLIAMAVMSASLTLTGCVNDNKGSTSTGTSANTSGNTNSSQTGNTNSNTNAAEQPTKNDNTNSSNTNSGSTDSGKTDTNGNTATKDDSKGDSSTTEGKTDNTATNNDSTNNATPKDQDTNTDNSSSEPAIKMVATGVTKCANLVLNDTDASKNDFDCSLLKDTKGNAIPQGQDGQVQAGKKMSYTLIGKDTQKVKKDDEGNVIGTTTIVARKCVKDNVTGLLWEQKTERNKDRRYTWYDAKTDVGTKTHKGCFGACNTSAHLASLNSTKLCGYDDWRLPTLEELRSIVDYSRTEPAINTTFFPHTVANGKYVSSSYGAQGVWYIKTAVESSTGSDHWGRDWNSFHLRAVRSDSAK